MVERERFVPHRVGELSVALAGRPFDDPEDADRFRAFCRLVSALYHYEFHDREQLLLEAWDRISSSVEAAQAVTAELTGLLDAANYTALGRQDLDDALERESLIPLRVEVDFDDYDELLIYRRASHRETVDIPKWRGLRSERKEITVDDRVVVHTRVKPPEWFLEQGIDPADRNLVPSHVSLKQFQNVPRADIEMLLPSAQVRFRLIDTLMIGVPAVASGILVLATKLLPTLGLIALLAGAWIGLRDDEPTLDQTSLVLLFGGVVAIGTFLFRQWTKLKNRRLAYLKTLSDNLYFRTLADGPGVLHTLLASAEEQEVIEVALAYRFLLEGDDGAGLTSAELDVVVEQWLRTTCPEPVDFEIGDAIEKLELLEIISGHRRLQAVPLEESLASLDRRWDDLFRHDGSLAGVTLTGGEGRADPGRLVRLRRVVDRFRSGREERRVERE